MASGELKLSAESHPMASGELKLSAESHPMVGGDGHHSYTHNSVFQKEVVDATKKLVYESIAEKLDLENPNFDFNLFRIADLGCSVGPNTFMATQNIMDAIEKKLCTQTNFHVFFNDHIENDFNTLFRSLPLSRRYFAAGVPGSFHGRLFPNSSLHFVYSSYSLHWLSKVPREVVDPKSPAWNKGSFYCNGLAEEVTKAYEDQFKRDMESFLNARAQEIVGGGLMAIVIGGMPDGVACKETSLGLIYDLILSSLYDLAKLELASEAKVESFNLPLYFPPKEGLLASMEQNGKFSIEKVDMFNVAKNKFMSPSVQFVKAQFRAFLEEPLAKHFGKEIVDDVFELFAKKAEENYRMIFNDRVPSTITFFVLLKRN